MRTPLILVVDDEALLRMLAADHFEDAGFEVLQAASGSEAIRVLTGRPDIKAVFTDIQMPGAPDGLELARLVRAQSPTCAIVVVSGQVEPSTHDLAAGARFVTKPYRGEDIVKLVRELIRPPGGSAS